MLKIEHNEKLDEKDREIQRLAYSEKNAVKDKEFYHGQLNSMLSKAESGQMDIIEARDKATKYDALVSRSKEL